MKKNSISKNFHQKNKRIDPTWYVHQTIYIDVTETFIAKHYSTTNLYIAIFAK